MHENKSTNEAIERADLHEFQSPREMLSWIVNRFERNEMPRNLDELRTMAEEIDTEGREQGFQASRVYVDVEGRLLTIARKEGDEAGLLGKTDHEKMCRISVDGTIIELALPPELQGRGTMRFMSGGGGADCIYNLGKYEATGGEYEDLPEHLRTLVTLYGSDMVLNSSIHYFDDVKCDGLIKAIGLSNIEDTVRKRQERLEVDEEAAYEIEHDAQKARENVKRGLFMTAKKHMQLQDQEYRRVIRYPNINKH